MTSAESLADRLGARMARVGERVVAARREHAEDAGARTARAGAADPEHTDEVIRARTGRGWDEWRLLIDAWPGHTDGHGAVARWLEDEHGVDGWWAQSVTVGWERLTGRRLPHQMADGTYTANRSATITSDADQLRALLLDAAGREVLFPGLRAELRSRPTSKNVRLTLDDGVAEIAMAPRSDGRVKVTVSHARLASPDEVGVWKSFWGDWLAALDLG